MRRRIACALFLIVHALSSTALAGPGPEAVASAVASVEYLARVMDQYHDRFPVSEDVSSARNHFHAFAKIPDENVAVDINGSWTDNLHLGAKAIRCEFRNTDGANFGGFYFLNGVLPPGETRPQLNFGTVADAGVDLSGATALTFWAGHDQGGTILREGFVLRRMRRSMGAILRPIYGCLSPTDSAILTLQQVDRS